MRTMVVDDFFSEASMCCSLPLIPFAGHIVNCGILWQNFKNVHLLMLADLIVEKKE